MTDTGNDSDPQQPVPAAQPAQGAGAAHPARPAARWRRRADTVVSHRATRWGAATVVTAVVGAVAAAVITPDLFGGSDDGPGGAPSPTVSAPTREKVVQAGAFSVSVPEDWGMRPSRWTTSSGKVGPGITVGLDPALPLASYEKPRAFVGASRSEAQRLAASFAEEGVDAVLASSKVQQDWSIDGCLFQQDIEVERSDGVKGTMREYFDCDARTDSLYDAFLVPPDATYLISVQATFPDHGSRAAAERIVESFRIDPTKLEATRSKDGVTP